MLGFVNREKEIEILEDIHRREGALPAALQSDPDCRDLCGHRRRSEVPRDVG